MGGGQGPPPRLAVFGSDGFMLPAMALIIVCFLVSSKSQKKEEPAL